MTPPECSPAPPILFSTGLCSNFSENAEFLALAHLSSDESDGEERGPERKEEAEVEERKDGSPTENVEKESSSSGDLPLTAMSNLSSVPPQDTTHPHSGSGPSRVRRDKERGRENPYTRKEGEKKLRQEMKEVEFAMRLWTLS